MSGCRISAGPCDLWWLVIPDSAALARIIIAMDYDQSGIATTYDEARALTPARRRRWQRLLSAHVDRTTRRIGSAGTWRGGDRRTTSRHRVCRRRAGPHATVLPRLPPEAGGLIATAASPCIPLRCGDATRQAGHHRAGPGYG